MKLRIFFIVLCFSLLPTSALAQMTLQENQNQLNCLDWSLGRDPACNAKGEITGNVNSTNSQNAIFDVLGDIIERLPFYLTIIAFFALLYSGGMYIFAMGDATKMEAAKKNMTWAAIGMVVMALTSIIIRFAAQFSSLAGGYLENINQLTTLIRS